MLSEVETVEGERNTLNESVMNVNILREKRNCKKEEKAEAIRNLYHKKNGLPNEINFSNLFKIK